MGQEMSAPYDVLRTRVLRAMIDQKWTRLGITSPNKACGKSTVSLNLALSLARQPELRIVLMDFDLRRPALARLLDFAQAEDMSTLLTGATRFEDHAFRIGQNLAVCPNRKGTRNSAELLQSSRTGEVLEQIETRWQPDLVLFDMPPMRGNDDSLAFLGRIDCALLVAAAGTTSLSQIESAEKEISTITNVLGTVLNKCRYLEASESYDADD